MGGGEKYPSQKFPPGRNNLGRESWGGEKYPRQKFPLGKNILGRMSPQGKISQAILPPRGGTIAKRGGKYPGQNVPGGELLPRQFFPGGKKLPGGISAYYTGSEWGSKAANH